MDDRPAICWQNRGVEAIRMRNRRDRGDGAGIGDVAALGSGYSGDAGKGAQETAVEGSGQRTVKVL